MEGTAKGVPIVQPHAPGARRRLITRVAAAMFLVAAVLAASPSGGLAPPLGAQTEDDAFLRPHPSVVTSDRLVCSLLGSQKSAVGIAGKDGGHSIVADGKTYWTFGDTLLSDNTFIPNTIAWSTDTDASDCVTLVPSAEAGQPLPLLAHEKDHELTVWPVGMEVTSKNRAHIYYTSVIRDPVTRWRSAGVGLAAADLTTLEAKRVLGGQLLWGQETEFPVSSARTYSDGVYVYVFLVFSKEAWVTETLMARVAKDEIESPARYEYWDPAANVWVGGLWNEATRTWKPELKEIGSLWRQSGMHNGIEVSYNAFLGRWTAVYATGFLTHLMVRTAESLTGPWGPETVLVRCSTFHPPPQKGYICYSGDQHDFFAKDGGRTVYVTYSNEDSYQVYMHEVRFAAAVREWTDFTGRAVYLPDTAKAPDGMEGQGIAFHASDIPAPGLHPIHRWEHGTTGQVRYGLNPPDTSSYRDAGVAFYAPATLAAAEATNAFYAPVYRWTKGTETRYSPVNQAPFGYARNEVAFYGACPDADSDGLTDCSESFIATDRYLADTDRDGWPDSEEDFDGDGCINRHELSAAAGKGGHRDPASYWDFFDTPDVNGVRDRKVGLTDIMRVLARFGARGNPGSDPVSSAIPPAPAYHTSFDRGGSSGSFLWSRGPADGAIGGPELMVMLAQFGHDCAHWP